MFDYGGASSWQLSWAVVQIFIVNCFTCREKSWNNIYAYSMVSNLRVDYFARAEEAPLFPKVLRNSLMIHNFPSPLLAIAFLSVIVLLCVGTFVRSCAIIRKPSLSLHNLVRLAGAFILSFGLAKQAILFASDKPYCVNEALLNMVIGVAGALFTLL